MGAMGPGAARLLAEDRQGKPGQKGRQQKEKGEWAHGHGSRTRCRKKVGAGEPSNLTGPGTS